MYQPPHFREERRDVLFDLIDRHPLGAIVVMDGNGFEINHVPCLIDRDRGPSGTLRLHVARANPLIALAAAGSPAVAIFQGAEAYITPEWYETKRETGKVVPTWNYAVVHAHGTLRAIDDADWLAKQIRDLTDRHEAARPRPWAVDDAPADYLRGQIKGIVGIEIEITRLDGKWKASQNRPQHDRAGVVAGLRREPDGETMAALVASRMPPAS